VIPRPVELRPDLVLVALPPRDRTTTGAGVIVLPAPSIMVDRLGVVLQVGARVDTLTPGARVLFGSDVGEALLIEDWPCLLLRAQDVDAVFEE
jgi:co-chaperonin GroES (HSP10)